MGMVEVVVWGEGWLGLVGVLVVFGVMGEDSGGGGVGDSVGGGGCLWGCWWCWG